ncbi:hypothetical protein SH449x_005390 [Pirellulaceae bacterium SH449]
MEFRNYYRRPKQTHRCGLASSGRACIHGPFGSHCGQSRDVPERCRPMRTLVGWTRLASAICTLLAIVTVTYWLTLSRNPLPIAPGPLTKAHAQLLVSGTSEHPLAIDDEKRCAACHIQSTLTNSTKSHDPAGSHLVSRNESATRQSELCMKCHLDTMPNGLLGNPHDLAGDDLAILFASVSGRPPSKLAQTPTECSQCHREHQGADGQLQSIASTKCQACHRNQFESFERGHPEFSTYPPAKPRSIGFDHARHAELHFAKKGKPFDCSVCHLKSQESSLVGSVFRSVSFEQACADCHNDSLKSAGLEGIVVFQVPSLDKAKLSRQGFDIGPWPESASLLMDGELTPLLTHMLRSNEKGREILERLPATMRLQDVDMNTVEQCQAIVDLADFVRDAWGQIASSGQPMLRNWLDTKVPPPTTTITTATPSTSSSLALYSRYVNTRASRMETPHPTTETPRDSAGSKEVWLDQLARGVPPDLLRSAERTWFQPASSVDIARLPVSILLSSAESIPISNRDEDDDDLLSNVGDDDLLGDDDDSLLGTVDEGSVMPSQQKNLGEITKPLKAWEHLPFGGWMLDESRVALVYVPTGHADPWLARWIEWNELSQHHSMDVNNGSTRNDPLSKQCIQCHSFDANRVRLMLSGKSDSNDALKSVALRKPADTALDPDWLQQCWKIEQRPNGLRELTRFNHTPHLTINSLRDCQSCHAMKKLDATQVSEQGWSTMGRTTRSEFQSLQKEMCATCHTKKAAGDACTQCHNYHAHIAPGR